MRYAKHTHAYTENEIAFNLLSEIFRSQRSLFLFLFHIHVPPK